MTGAFDPEALAQLGHDPVTGEYDPKRDTTRRNGKVPATGGRRLTLTPADRIKSGRVRWLWQGWVPLGALTVVAGEPGLGKSTLTGAHLAALATRGALDGELRGKPADVLIASAEDDWSAVIVPRLMAANANLERVHRIDVMDEDGAGLFTLPNDVARLTLALDALQAAGRTVAMIVVDPVGAFLSGSTDSHKDASVRRALTPLAQLGMDRGLAVVAVAHLTKDASQRLMSRVSGSVAFGAAPRSVIGFARDPDDPDGEQGADRIIVHAKSNVGRYATSLTARVESRMVDTHDGLADTGFLLITGESSICVDDLQRGRDDDGPDCEEAIGQALAGGGRPSREVKAEVAAEVGCARKTVERAAVRMRERGEITIEKGGFPPTSTWTLANGDAPMGTHDHTLSVPNGGPLITRGVSADASSNGDTPGVVVPIGNGHDPDAVSDRLREKFPDLEATEVAARCRCGDRALPDTDEDGDGQCARCGRGTA
jgi:AAA domain-containing protein